MKNKGLMLGIVFLVGIAVLAALFINERGGQDSTSTPLKAAVGQPAPDFSLQDTDGKVWTLSGLRGKVVVVNFWATWCPSCVEELPSMQRFINAASGDPSFVFVSVLYQDDPKAGVAYLKKNGFSFPVLIDDGRSSSVYGLTGVPETFIIDKSGVTVKKIIGPIDWDAPEVAAFFQKLLKQ